jgi:hypothetical protein
VDPGALSNMNYNTWSGGLGQLDQYAVDRHRRDAFNLLASLGINTGGLGLPYGQGKTNQVFPQPLPPMDHHHQLRSPPSAHGLDMELAALGHQPRMVTQPQFGRAESNRLQGGCQVESG